MPLSKERDKARKRIERAMLIVQPKSNLNDVQPKLHNSYSANHQSQIVPELDADGNLVPDFW